MLIWCQVSSISKPWQLTPYIKIISWSNIKPPVLLRKFPIYNSTFNRSLCNRLYYEKSSKFYLWSHIGFYRNLIYPAFKFGVQKKTFWTFLPWFIIWVILIDFTAFTNLIIRVNNHLVSSPTTRMTWNSGCIGRTGTWQGTGLVGILGFWGHNLKILIIDYIIVIVPASRTCKQILLLSV